MRLSDPNRPAPSRHRRGAMMVLVGVMLVVLCSMAAFAVDIGLLVVSKTNLGTAADSAALAGASALVEAQTLGDVEKEALKYAKSNEPLSHTTVSFGKWDPAAKTFTPDVYAPNAIRVIVERTAARGNPVPLHFAKIFGMGESDITAEAIAVGSVPNAITSTTTTSVYVTSTKDLSNVVLEFADGSEPQKFEGLSGYTGTFSGPGDNAGKEIVGVWIKSGCNKSNDGPGYGEYIAYSDNNTTVHGNNVNKGCTPHVTASFASTGVTFTDSGSASPVRLVK
jgi:hypothetical protein